MDRFWDKVDKTDTCWVWTASAPTGYGQFKLEGKYIPAHRMSWILHNGCIPCGLSVCHTCDVRLCVNPDHLWLGTSKQNTQDMISKGRDNNTRSILHVEEVLVIKRLIKSSRHNLADIGRMFSVSRASISDISLNKTWKDT